MTLPISVLMSTYRGETPGNLAAALESLYAQTAVPAEVVLAVSACVKCVSACAVCRIGTDSKASARIRSKPLRNIIE